MNDFRPTSGELRKAKEIAEEGVEKASSVLPKEKSLKTGFGWTESPFTLEKMSGVSGKSFGPNFIHIQFNTEVDGWKDSLLATAVHEYGHAWFYENIEDDYAKVLWQYLIDEALTQNLAEDLVPEFESPWRKEFSKEEIAEYWPEIKENLGREVNHPDPLFINQGEGGYPNWLGYSMSYLIGKKLQEDGFNLEDFPDLEKNDLIRVAEELFGKE
jgi:uncharacterized protein YjaZ